MKSNVERAVCFLFRMWSMRMRCVLLESTRFTHTRSDFLIFMLNTFPPLNATPSNRDVFQFSVWHHISVFIFRFGFVTFFHFFFCEKKFAFMNSAFWQMKNVYVRTKFPECVCARDHTKEMRHFTKLFGIYVFACGC